MKSVIFVQDVMLKDYLKARFKCTGDNIPSVYISGNHELRIPFDINQLYTILKPNMLADYQLFLDGEEVVEEVEIDGMTFHVRSKQRPEEIMANEKLLKVLRISVFKKMDESVTPLNLVEYLKDIKFHIYHNSSDSRSFKIEFDRYPYLVNFNNAYITVKSPILYNFEDELNKYNAKISKSLNSIKKYDYIKL